MNKTMFLPVLLLTLCLAVAGCGGGSAEPTAKPTAKPAATKAAPTPTTKVEASPTEAPAAETEAPAGDALPGDQLYVNLGCAGCHTLDGSVLVGPSWQGVFGSTEELEDGSSVTVDAAYIIESIKDPNAKIVKGYMAGLMPILPVTDAEIANLIEFIKAQ